MSFAWIAGAVLSLFLASQVYWLWRGYRLAGRRKVLSAVLLAAYLALFAWNFGWLGGNYTPTRLTFPEAVFTAPFRWWMVSSMVGFLIVLLFWPARRAARAAGVSPGRRQFLEHTANAAAAAPFVAGAYGLFYGRLNLEVTHPRIRLERLPRAFEGFRIAQLSDIHIGPFMPETEIRNYVRIANSLKPDLIVLTGDFITWDAHTQHAVVQALAGLRAPFGVFGCLGNHEMWSHTEDSITALFHAAGIPILRQARVPIASHGEQLNLMGIDYHGAHAPLDEVETMLVPGLVNILLSHHPDTFDRAAELGVDLSLAGHTHGGQVALEFVNPQLAPSRLVTPYVSGWFQKPGGQLYVNRGIGTIGVPIRAGSPPEISVFELVRA